MKEAAFVFPSFLLAPWLWAHGSVCVCSPDVMLAFKRKGNVDVDVGC